ncbi:site-specific DNA-methyltransferase [soil metagenome]
MTRRPTTTRAFGSGRRESHDATGFYGRFVSPEVSDDADVRPPVTRDEIFCRDAVAMTEAEVADKSVALVVTSPPYFTGKAYEEDLEEGHVPVSYVDYLDKLTAVLAVCVDKLEPGGRIAVNVANLGRKPYRSLSADVIGILQDHLGLLLRGESYGARRWEPEGRARGGLSARRPTWCCAMSPSGWSSPRRVDSTERSPANAARSWACPTSPQSKRTSSSKRRSTSGEYPPSRPLALGIPPPSPSSCPAASSSSTTYRGDLVLDPYMGSGSTALAALGSDRHYIGFDTDPAYVALAHERVSRFRATLPADSP